MEAITVQQMREIERSAIDSGAVTGLELMERAGQGVVEAVMREWPELAAPGHRAVVLCGPGNNGGDGFVVARLLRDAGWRVDVFFYGTPDKLPPDARINHDHYSGMGEIHKLSFPVPEPREIARFCDAASHRQDIALRPEVDEFQPFLMVDALFGIGLTRPLTGLDTLETHWDYLSTFRDLNDTRIVAIDVCSGLDADTGAPLWGEDSVFPVLQADIMVTFHRPKLCHKPEVCDIYGKLVVIDIGL